jgi:hypothetical protein
MAQNENLFEDAVDELDELDADMPDLDDFGDDEVFDDELDGLSSDVDRWDADDYDNHYNADRAYLYGLLR